MMPRITASIAQDVADAMTLLRELHDLPRWQVPGCKALLRDAADMAPAGELARAALAFAESGVKAPSLEIFRDPSGPWWHAPMPEHARTVRPRDLPRCPVHDVQLPASGLCSSCEAERKAAEHPAEPVRKLSEEQRAAVTRGADTVRAAMREHGIPERRMA